LARVAYGDLAFTPVAARDVDRKLTGFASVSPASSLKGAVHVTVRPECHVSGTIVCDELTKAGKPLGWTNAYLLYGGQRIGDCDLTPGEFEFPVPPGSYTLDLYGTSLRHKQVDVTVPEGRADFQIHPAVSLVASKLAWLEGQPAPELEGVVGWRGKPTKLADLKGKYVLIDFWGYWCGPCVQAMPVLITLHERFKDKGLAIIGVHCDMDGEVSTSAMLDEKLAPLKKNLWQGKDLPFPVALTTKDYMDGPQPTSRSTAAQYGILGFPTTILIDRDGKVVGTFEARVEKEAVAEVEKLLKSDK
jgi:thiol-disulfide isomerase/thioredoxin